MPPKISKRNAAPSAENAPVKKCKKMAQVEHDLVHKLLQFDPGVNPVSLTRGTFAAFPASLPIPHEFDLSMVQTLRDADEFVLVPGKRKGGIERYCLKRRASDTYLTPKDKARIVQVKINGKKEYFNVATLLASSVLEQDVTDNEWGALIDTDGIWMENDTDRKRLVEDLKKKCENLPRVDLDIIPRPGSEPINVAGKYYTQGGKVYTKKGNAIRMQKSGLLRLTSDGSQKEVHLGRILFTAYPDLYKFVPEFHDQTDHIDGDHTNNVPWNFRPVTRHQNYMVRVQSGDRSKRPDPSSSFEMAKKWHTDMVRGEPVPEESARTCMKESGFRRYKKTGYWVDRNSCVLKWKKVNGRVVFEFAEARVGRNDGYTFCRGGHSLHRMVVETWGTDDQKKKLRNKNYVVMHLDNNKQNNRIENLEMGTHSDNAHKKSPVTITIDGGDPQTFRSQSEAARETGIHQPTIHKNMKRNIENRKRKRDLQSTTTRGPSPITFTAISLRTK